MEGAGEWTLQLSHKISPLLLLLPPAAPLWGPSPAVGYGPSQASWNVSPFLPELLQHECFPWDAVLQAGSQLLPENLLQWGLLLISHSSCQEPAPAVAFHELQPPHALPTCSGVAPPKAAV